jgi:hypothetical protein
MDSVSRPLIALLLSTVAVFAVWFVALKPSSSGSGGAGASNQGALTSAITKAHQAVGTSAAASAAHGGTVLAAKPAGARGAATAATPPASGTALRTAPKTASPAHALTTATTPTTPTTPTTAATPAHRANAVTRALNANKTLALLFYNPAAADDRAVRKELAAVPVHRGRVVKLAVPLIELARYQAVTNSVTVSVSPTLVLIDSAHHASTLVGFADRFEIAQRVADALASP